MTYYVVKHGASDYRLHTESGTETGDTWTKNPLDPANGLIDDVSAAVAIDRGVSSGLANNLAPMLNPPLAYRRVSDTPW